MLIKNTLSDKSSKDNNKIMKGRIFMISWMAMRDSDKELCAFWIAPELKCDTEKSPYTPLNGLREVEALCVPVLS